MTPIIPGLNPDKVYIRGFITKEEAELLDTEDVARKINLVDTDGGGEGPWGAFISKEDEEVYENKSSYGEELRCVLLNNAIAFMPNRSWGRVMVGKTKGELRPLFKAEDQIDRFKATHAAYMEEYGDLDKEQSEDS